MTREPGARPAPTAGQPAQGGAQPAQKQAGGASIFSKGEREGEKAAAEQREGQPAGQGGGGGQ
jgi:hypothetical protein